MRAKRAKQYRKLMQQYGLTFGFHEPYQVVVDARMLQDAERFKIDLVKGLERTLHGKVKPMITQCSIRHLYNATPKNDALIGQAKALERRRCNHHLLDEPLSTLECLSSVVDPKDQNVNKYNYVVASQDDEVRANMRRIPGVPLIYIKRSIMILEPMAGASEDQRSREERGKFKLGISRTGGRGSTLGKRRREEEEADGVGNENSIGVTGGTNGQDESARKKKKRGPKGPNPLSVKKPKVRAQMEPSSTAKTQPVNETNGDVVKKKRKRKHKDKEGSGTDGIAATTGGDVSDG